MTFRPLWVVGSLALLVSCGEDSPDLTPSASNQNAANVEAPELGGGGHQETSLHLEMSQHLVEMLDRAHVEGSQPSEDGTKPMHWGAAELASAWSSLAATSSDAASAVDTTPRLETTDEALRIHLEHAVDDLYGGYALVELPSLQSRDWKEVQVRMQSDGVRHLTLGFNLGEGSRGAVESRGERTVVDDDGQVHTYRLGFNSDDPYSRRGIRGPLEELVLEFQGPRAASADLISVSFIPKSQEFAEPVQVLSVTRGSVRQNALAFHTPAALSFPVEVPPGGRLDASLAASSSSEEITFRVLARDGGSEEVLFEQTSDETSRWTGMDVDLSAFAGRTIDLVLEGTSETAGKIGFWGAPTVTGDREVDQPNVILYVIDGAGADLMSVYGYERKTTKFMEKLAAEATIFEYCHTNSGWTKSSTASFMTSLHHSILGGFASNSDQIPGQAVTMAQRFHRAGYQTAVFTSNPFAGSLSGLQRDVDVFSDRGARHNSASSVELQNSYWEWREEWPGSPYWVHFQTTDVHEPHDPPAPFAGLFVSPEEREQFEDWSQQIRRFRWGGSEDSVLGNYRAGLERAGIEPREYFRIQNGLYDESMAHNDYQLSRLVQGLKDRGEWDNTLLIITSDHGHPAGSFSRFGRGQIQPEPEDWEGALADSYRTRIPLIMIWPGHIPAGQRIRERVSMIDLLPTVMELVGLPQPETLQGRSLVPLIQGDPDWETQPIIFDQFQADRRSGEMAGHLEMIDGKWAASLEVVHPSIADAYRAGKRELQTAGGHRAARPHRHTTPPLLLYDIEQDPFCTRNVNQEHPELVAEFTEHLQELWQAHLALAEVFTSDGTGAAMTAEQLRTLQDLGYVR